MKNQHLSILMLILFTTTVYAIEKDTSVYIYGQVTSDYDQDSIRLIGWVIEREVKGIFTGTSMSIVKEENGRFNITIPSVKHPIKIEIFDDFTGNKLFGTDEQLAEAGDSIHLKGTIHNREEPYYFKAEFSGRGSAKYNCVQALKLVDSRLLTSGQIPLTQKHLLADSLLIEKIKVLNRFKSQITDAAYNIMKADIIGGIYNTLLFAYSIKASSEKLSADEKKIIQLYFNDKTRGTDTILAYSNNYTNFLRQKTKMDLELEYGEKRYPFKILYLRLRNEYNGLIRDKLLADCILDASEIALYFGYCDADEFTWCMKDAASLIQTPFLRQLVQHQLETRGKGRMAFNFKLPLDSSNRKISLTDLRGKVVLLEMWNYQCSGCAAFSKSFHEVVFPKFKNNPYFQIVSIFLDNGMLGDTNAIARSKAAYIRRLRRENNTTYTYPQYINLYGGKGESSARCMEKHYAIYSFPFILLLDKKGRIYSSTVPYFNDNSSQNVERLIDLIKQLLTASS